MPMSLFFNADPKKKILFIAIFFVLLFLAVEASGLRTVLSPDTVKALFLEHTFWGLVLFCVAFSIGNLLYVPGWVFLVGAVFALGKEWGGVATILAGVCSATGSFFLIRAVGGGSSSESQSQMG